MKKITCSFIKDKKLLGFTLAEVLITLTIIGVVAALTIPSLLANVNDKTYDAKRQAFKTRFAQAVAQLDAINAYGTGDAETNSMNFITEGLSKTLKITNVCEYDSYSACDFAASITEITHGWSLYLKDFKTLRLLSGNIAARFPDSQGAFFRTRNGESIAIWYYPDCTGEKAFDANNQKDPMGEICAIMIFDLDGGKKGPNTTTKDIGFASIFYSDNPVISFMSGAVGSWNTSNAPQPPADGINAESACNNVNYYGFPKGSFKLLSYKEYFAFAAFYNISTGVGLYGLADTEGVATDDYRYGLRSYRYIERIKRSQSVNNLCVVKFNS